MLKQDGKEIKVKLEAIQYNNDSVIKLPETEFNYEWSINKETNQIKELEQKIETEDQFEIKAK